MIQAGHPEIANLPPEEGALQRNLKERADSIKGLLISLVVLGHMAGMQHEYRPAYNMLYIFHVAAFLALPFLHVSRPLTKHFLVKRSITYGIPFFWFFSLATLLFAVMFLYPQGVGIFGIARSYATGLAIASAHVLDIASGLKLFWFLPALFTLTVLRAAWVSYPRARSGILLGCLLVNLLAGDFGLWRHYVPWGVIIVAYIFPLGILVAWLTAMANRYSKPVRVLYVILALEFLILAYQESIFIDLGDLVFYGAFTSPQEWLIVNVALVTSISAIFLMSRLWRLIPGLALVGTLSLPIYLIHSFVNQAFIMAFERPLTTEFGNLFIQFVLVLCVSTALAFIILKVRFIHQLLFPRDVSDLRTWPATLLNTLRPKPQSAKA